MIKIRQEGSWVRGTGIYRNKAMERIMRIKHEKHTTTEGARGREEMMKTRQEGLEKVY